jgi:diguanylate cyclase (GGDEF)-like protein
VSRRGSERAAEEAATHDPLTRPWNHDRIIEILFEELSRADRQGQPVSLAMLDHFKLVNDTYGHVVGDEVLREVVRRLERAIRVYDSIGRFGGEEFMIVLPASGGLEAERAAERIRAGISREPVLTSAGTVRITGSLGVVTHVGEATSDATVLLVAADDALYDSKAGARPRHDRVAAAGELAGPTPDRADRDDVPPQALHRAPHQCPHHRAIAPRRELSHQRDRQSDVLGPHEPRPAVDGRELPGALAGDETAVPDLEPPRRSPARDLHRLRERRDAGDPRLHRQADADAFTVL